MKKDNLIMYALAGLLVLSFLFGIISVLYATVEKLSSTGLTDQLKEYEKRGNEVSAVESNYKKWKNIDKEFARFNSEYLMTFDEFAKFRNDLLMTLAKFQLNNSQFQPRYTNMFDKLMRVDMKFNAKGTYPNLKRFIREILSQKKIVLLKGVDFSKDKMSDEIGANFELEVYLVK